MADEEDPNEMVAVNMKIPRGARDRLLALAELHGATVTKNRRQIPSLLAFVRMLAADSIPTVKNLEIVSFNDPSPYPYCRGSAKKKAKAPPSR